MSLPGALRHQGDICTQMGSPFTGRLLHLIADRLAPGTALTDRLLGWQGDLSASAQSVPLRIAGALHGLVIDGSDAGLAAAYPPNTAGDDQLWAAITSAFETHAVRLDTWLDEAPQTNEVARSAVLIAVGHWLGARFGLPLALSELGASAGLNLMWDRYALEAGGARLGPAAPALTLRPDWRGAPPPPPSPALQVSARGGVDLNPLDASRDGLRLLAYVWPDQPERLARCRAALAVAEAEVARGDAAPWLEAQLSAPRPGACHLIYHTVAWQYFPPEVQARCRAAIEAAGARATADAPLAWFGMEADSRDMAGAALTLRLWPGDLRLEIGRADFHARWVDWQAPGATSTL